MAKMKKLKMEIMRYNPETDDVPYSVTYEVPYDEQTSLLNKLQDARQDRERGLLFVSSAG